MELSDITITRPVTEADREWITTMRSVLARDYSPDPYRTIRWEQERSTFSTSRPVFTGIAPTRSIPCHPTRPII